MAGWSDAAAWVSRSTSPRTAWTDFQHIALTIVIVHTVVDRCGLSPPLLAAVVAAVASTARFNNVQIRVIDPGALIYLSSKGTQSRREESYLE